MRKIKSVEEFKSPLDLFAEQRFTDDKQMSHGPKKKFKKSEIRTKKLREKVKILTEDYLQMDKSL